MGQDGCWQEFGKFLDDCERQGNAVKRVEVMDTGDEETAGVLTQVELETSFDGSEACEGGLGDPRVGPDGTIRFALAGGFELVPETDQEIGIEPTGATMIERGVRVTLAATLPDATTGSGGEPVVPDAVDFPTPEESDDIGSDEDDGAETASRDSDVPPFKDPDLLADVYETHDTFAEMAEVLDMDVTAETVRRYMIDYEIHEPDSYQVDGAAAAGDDDPHPVVLSDGIGLPDDVTVDAFIETVQRSNTIYEVKQDIDIGRQDALEMLQELNLLDLVVGRLATETDRNITREDVVQRLREASAEQ